MSRALIDLLFGTFSNYSDKRIVRFYTNLSSLVDADRVLLLKQKWNKSNTVYSICCADNIICNEAITKYSRLEESKIKALKLAL